MVENELGEGGIVGLLLCDGGGCKFLDQVFLYLQPADLKASRLVCWAWHDHIVERLWKTEWGKRRLRWKAVNRWVHPPGPIRNVEAELGKTRSQVRSLHCDNKHVFCGQENQVVAVHSVDNGRYEEVLDEQNVLFRWVRDLPVGQAAAPHCLPTVTGVLVDGDTSVVAAVVIKDRVTAIWSKDGSMQQLHQGCHAGSGIMYDIKVADGRVVTMAQDGTVVVLVAGEGRWEVKWVFQDEDFFASILHCNGDWVARGKSRRSKIFGDCISLWHGGEKKKDISVDDLVDTAGRPVKGFCHLADLLLHPPYIILSLWKSKYDSSTNKRLPDPYQAILRVCLLDSHKVVKTLCGFGRPDKLILGQGNVGQTIWKKIPGVGNPEKMVLCVHKLSDLLDGNPTPIGRDGYEKSRSVELGEAKPTVSMNLTSLVVARGMTLSIADFWVKRGKGEEELERERAAEEVERQRSEEEARVEELMASRPSYVDPNSSSYLGQSSSSYVDQNRNEGGQTWRGKWRGSRGHRDDWRRGKRR